MALLLNSMYFATSNHVLLLYDNDVLQNPMYFNILG
jgi:hypothetical protein